MPCAQAHDDGAGAARTPADHFGDSPSTDALSQGNATSFDGDDPELDALPTRFERAVAVARCRLFQYGVAGTAVVWGQIWNTLVWTTTADAPISPLSLDSCVFRWGSFCGQPPP